MPQMLLINPAKSRRRTAKRKGSGKRRSAAQRRAAAALVALNRRKNPAPRRAKRVGSKRRRNPISIRSVARRVIRRRRNPSLRMGGGLFKLGTYLGPIKDAAIMGAGAVAMDVAFGYINPMLPASMRKVPGTIGIGDAVKAVLTIAIGNLFSGATLGLSRKAAMGAMVVQARDIAVTLLPAGATVNGLGFVTSGRVVNGTTGRVNSNMAMQRLNAYTGGPGQTPLLSGVGQYSGGPGQSPLLSRAPVRAI